MDEGEDWQDVQIPAKKKKAKEDSAEPAAEASSPAAAVGGGSDGGGRSGEHQFEHAPNVGPAANLLMAQYGIKSR